MASVHTYRVFVSYTGKDLETHAEVVSDMIQRLNSEGKRSWVSIDHKFWTPTGNPSVPECKKRVEQCQVLVVLVAFRYGWVPTVEEGGDGETSITELEVEWARAAGLEVIPFLVEENANWNIADVEGLRDPIAQERLNRFRAKLSGNLAGFFETPVSLEAGTVMALNAAADRMEESRVTRKAAPELTGLPDGDDVVVPFYFDPDHPPTLSERLEAQLPKRILSLDSAGVRTAIAIGYLERLEALLSARYGDADFRLSNYFDLIGGVGVSAITAAELALGRSVAEARKTFCDGMNSILSTRSWLRAGLFRSLYRAGPIRELLNAAFGDTVLGSEELNTGLCVPLTRIDTEEISALTNHPRIPNAAHRDLPLSEILLASVSLPISLPPVELQLPGDTGFYLSGETSLGPDPALYLFLVATGPTFPFRWRTGRRRISLTSVGAGEPPAIKRRPDALTGQRTIRTLVSMLRGLKQQSQLALAALTHEELREGSTGSSDQPGAEAAQSILRYRRFDVSLDPETLKGMGFAEHADNFDPLIRMDALDRIGYHLVIGSRAAERQLTADMFSPSFDVRPRPGAADALSSFGSR